MVRVVDFTATGFVAGIWGGNPMKLYNSKSILVELLFTPIKFYSAIEGLFQVGLRSAHQLTFGELRQLGTSRRKAVGKQLAKHHVVGGKNLYL